MLMLMLMMMLHLLATLITTTTLCRATNTDIITLSNGGRIQGGTNKNAQFWVNVPYAQPPLNELRWRPTYYPASTWNETRDATKQGYKCLGPKVFHALTDSDGHEDCLTLIFTHHIQQQQRSQEQSACSLRLLSSFQVVVI